MRYSNKDIFRMAKNLTKKEPDYIITDYFIDDDNTLHTFVGDKKHVTFSDIDSLHQAETLIYDYNMRQVFDRGFFLDIQ